MLLSGFTKAVIYVNGDAAGAARVAYCLHGQKLEQLAGVASFATGAFVAGKTIFNAGRAVAPYVARGAALLL